MPTKAERRLIRQWEETLIADYDNFWSHKLLDPLYAQFNRWSAGEMDNDDLFQAIHEVHKANRERYNFFVNKRAELVRYIQMDPWFTTWLEEHPAPAGADLVPDELKSSRWEEMESLEEEAGETDETSGEDAGTEE